MFSKNIKTLSLFLVLAAVMIVAVGAVSAANTDIVDGAVTGTGDFVISNDGSSNSSAVGTINGTVTTTGEKDSVSANTVVNSTINKDGTFNSTKEATVATDGKVYTKNADGTYNEVTGVTVPTTDVTLGTDGTFSQTVTLTNSTTSSGVILTNGGTYYLHYVLPAVKINSSAFTGDVAYIGDGTHFVMVQTPTTGDDNYIAFTYKTPSLSLVNNDTTISYGDAWSFTGTLTDEDGKTINNQLVNATVKLNGADDSTAKTVSIYTGATGIFTLASSSVGVLDANTANNYTVTFAYAATTNTYTTTANLNVTQKKITASPELNATTVKLTDDLKYTVTFTDANGKTVDVTGVKYALKDATGAPIGSATELTPVDGVATVDDLSNGLTAGTYYVYLTYTGNNYVLDSTTLSFTVSTVKPVVIINPNPISGITGEKTTVALKYNTTTTGLIGVWTVYYLDSNNVPTIISTTDKNSTSITVEVPALAKGDYTLYAEYNSGSVDYETSNATAAITVKALNTIDVKDPADFIIGTTGNDTFVNVTSTPDVNTTFNVIINNKSAGTIKVTDGKGALDLGSLNLGAGEYNITVIYPGDDTYNAVNKTITVNVIAKNIGDLNKNVSSVTGVTINSANKTFTLNLTNGTAKTLVNYTGDVNYYNAITGKLLGTVSMVEGKAIVDATTLKGLSDGKNLIKFQINNNATSEPVTIIISTVAVSTIINADNVSTNNATPITITGTIVNATEGTVNVNLKDAKNKTIATVTGNVAADGTFTVAFGNYANGVYTAEINYTSATGLSKASTKNVTVTVNGTAPTPVVGNVTTNLTINTNFTEAYGQGLNLTGKLTDANGNPIVGQHIALNLTNPTTGASKIYWVTTDTNGEYQLQINLFAGSYTASASFGGFTTADNKTYYLPSGPANGTITVTNGTEPVDNRTATVLAFSNFTEKYGQALNFTGTLKTTDGTPIVGQKLNMVLSNAAGQSKLYWRTTDTNGEVQLPIELFAGDYTFKCYFEGDSTYQPSNNQTGSITVTA